MDRRTYLSAAGLAAAAALAGCTRGLSTGPDGPSDGADGGQPGEFAVEEATAGLTEPWGMAHLPDGLLVTERTGRLTLVDRSDGTTERVEGIPPVFAQGQGGLLDVALHPEFPEEPWVYLTYAGARGDGTSTTHLGRGRFDPDGPRLADFEVLYVAEPFVRSSGHFGSRAAFGPDEHLYVTVGDRQFKDFGPDHVAQDPTNDLGTTLRLHPDGSVPETNPFVGGEGRDAVFSYGHRNAQGLAVHPDGGIWQSEFGERDGDEINAIERGGNYGWPVASESCAYGTDRPVGVPHDERPDVVAPVYAWACGTGGFPPSGMAFYDGEAFPGWRGDLFVGGLASRALARFVVDGREVAEPDLLLADRGQRLRDVAVAPDTGHIYVAVDAGDAPILRLVPP
jgi:quinoprotein glucose dehydrogenase